MYDTRYRRHVNKKFVVKGQVSHMLRLITFTKSWEKFILAEKHEIQK